MIFQVRASKDPVRAGTEYPDWCLDGKKAEGRSPRLSDIPQGPPSEAFNVH